MSGTHHPVIILDSPPEPIDLTVGYDIERLRTTRWGVGGYLERRTSSMYSSDLYAGERNVHVGIDIWGPAGTPVRAFTDGVVWAQADNRADLDYGPTIVVQHEVGGSDVWVLYGHLSRTFLERRTPGDRVEAGDVLGAFGTEAENGGWLPHLHLQVARQPPQSADMPGVVHPDDVGEARELYPDPSRIIIPIWKVGSMVDS